MKMVYNKTKIVILETILVFSLLVHCVVQFKLRKALEENVDAIPDQKGGQIAKPTIRWVFQIFDKITLLIILRNSFEKILCILNLKEIHRKILMLLGANYKKNIFVLEGCAKYGDGRSFAVHSC